MHLSAGQAFRLYTVRIGAGAVFGDRLLHLYYRILGAFLGEFIGLLVVLGAVVLIDRLKGIDRFVGLFLVVTSGLILVFAMLERSDGFARVPNIGLIRPPGVLFNGRYMGVPAFCIALVAIMASDRLRTRTARQGWRVLLLTLTALYGLMLVANIPVDLYRPTAANFQQHLRQAEAACKANRGKGLVIIQTGPFSHHGGFQFVVSCHQAFG
jgi:hypothetical protein